MYTYIKRERERTTENTESLFASAQSHQIPSSPRTGTVNIDLCSIKRALYPMEKTQII